MFSIAYRMLGTVGDAEDMVQQAYLRYQATPSEQIVSHKAFLSTVVTRLCINHLQRAQNQRETYIGPWLPEPVLTQTDDRLMPVERVELHESLSLAFLALLERLTPAERAVFLLREVFDYSFGNPDKLRGLDLALDACGKVASIYTEPVHDGEEGDERI